MEALKRMLIRMAEALDYLFPYVSRGMLFAVFMFIVITPFFGIDVEISNNGVVIIILFALYVEIDGLKREKRPTVEISLQCDRGENCEEKEKE